MCNIHRKNLRQKANSFQQRGKTTFQQIFFFAFGRLSQLRENIWFISNSKTKKKIEKKKNSNSKNLLNENSWKSILKTCGVSYLGGLLYEN